MPIRKLEEGPRPKEMVLVRFYVGSYGSTMEEAIEPINIQLQKLGIELVEFPSDSDSYCLGILNHLADEA